MSPLKKRWLEDRAMRDAAREVVTSDVSFIKTDVAQQSVGSRMAESGQNTVRMMALGVADVAADNRGKVGAGLALAAAGLAAWVFRKPIAEALEGFLSEFENDVADDAGEDADCLDSDEEPAADPGIPETD
ncbi:hypothetical protein [Alteraurantiacibacter aquimixticola]|uniref:Uncharacterized protein n=1 Tax=Alteraurantiacibacter aquimixticola TaxID=2489173 RepID=A0A4T3F173_9SPHN|nr:hypothetical protein [Alteraurantiacibacter aquimixticola]TIX50015.1 hypothetical protein E5222_06850 [Alteraurantiacibacter aquimixticola]